jgi:hypothetical protein
MCLSKLINQLSKTCYFTLENRSQGVRLAIWHISDGCNHSVGNVTALDQVCRPFHRLDKDEVELKSHELDKKDTAT